VPGLPRSQASFVWKSIIFRVCSAPGGLGKIGAEVGAKVDEHVCITGIEGIR